MAEDRRGKYRSDEELIGIAKRFKTIKEFRLYDESAYKICRTRKLEEAFAHMPERCVSQRRLLTRDLCMEVAAQYKTLEELRINDNPVYCKIMRKGWYKDICGHLYKAWTPKAKVVEQPIEGEPRQLSPYEFTHADIVTIRNLAKKNCKEGWIVNASSRVIKGIFKGLVRCEGNCPCANESTELQCPCSGYREHDHCCCGLYLKLEE